MKKLVALVTILVLFLGGCSVLNQTETLTREQQNNVVRRIVRGYDIKKIEFTGFSRDKKTGTYLLNIKINNDENKQTTIALNNMSSFEKEEGIIGLNPIGRFQEIERDTDMEDNADVDLTNISIKYLEE